MNFFIDFEATQFSQRIISIGCVAENGERFSTLVKPVNKDKVNVFITELTGITNDELLKAPTADEAFEQFYNFVEKHNGNTYPQYYCYGDSDGDFIAHTVKYMTSFKAITFALSLQKSLVNYAALLKNSLKLNNPMSLRAIYYVLVPTEQEQQHDALEDAEMLKTIFEHSKELNKDKCAAAPLFPTIKPPKKKAPEIFVNWPNKKENMFIVDTLANENNWSFYAEDVMNGKKKYFNTVETAVLWLMKYRPAGPGFSPKNPAQIKKIQSKINKALEKNSNYCNFKWIMKGEDTNV